MYSTVVKFLLFCSSAPSRKMPYFRYIASEWSDESTPRGVEIDCLCGSFVPRRQNHTICLKTLCDRTEVFTALSPVPFLFVYLIQPIQVNYNAGNLGDKVIIELFITLP